MPEPVPRLLARYLEDALRPSILCVVTSTSSTPANWVLVRLLHAALHALESSDPKKLEYNEAPLEHSPHVVFVSLFRPLELWTELCKKVVCLINL